MISYQSSSLSTKTRVSFLLVDLNFPALLTFLVSPLVLNAETFPRVTTVVDVSLATAPVPLAVRALSSQRTLFLSGADIYAYLRKLEVAENKLREVDFVALKGETAVGTAAQSKPTDIKEKKEDAKIEGAVQIAIGVKKEVDFAAWYTNVCICALVDVSH
jgi:prolyl-tRNA synthetase